MKLGFVSAILPELSLREVLQLASQCGYDCVELMCWPAGKAERRYAGVSHVDVAEIVRTGSASRLTDLCEEFNVSASALGYYPNLLDADTAATAAAAEHLKLVMDAAAIAGIECVTSFVGRDYRRSVDDNWPRFLEVWRPLIEHAESRNVRIGIENCPMSFSADEWPGGKNLATTPAIWRRMFADIPSAHFGLNYDPSHLIWQQMDYLKPIREFADRFFHVHAKDVRIDRQRLDDVGIMAHPAEYHTPKLPGMGDVDWGQFFSALTDSVYDGPVCVEVEDRAYEGTLDDRRKSLVQSHTFLRNYVPA
ncbi:sugar phosphate isomerase/epimerase family protein [Roseimaritima ulvae]|uniref:Inosose dehydratase n=1 Tax=Roseimaritima ulvae TaxID=980254 RepID=A0A5B9QT10_9BACT|nr:sugar phosphate isomerase/epimerase [Roseimaritima ulvae]QEG41079.1 Inosose dehydratase [Roseimaritima ulvae]